MGRTILMEAEPILYSTDIFPGGGRGTNVQNCCTHLKKCIFLIKNIIEVSIFLFTFQLELGFPQEISYAIGKETGKSVNRVANEI